MKFHRRTLVAIPALLSFGVLLPAGAVELPPTIPPPAEDSVLDGEEEYRALPDLPLGVAIPGIDGVTGSAIRLAASLRAVPLAEGSSETCPEDRLTVGWDEPGPSYGHGAFIAPLGPAPTARTTSVNGVVTCTTSDWAFMGFEARYVNGRWDVVAVPFVDEEEVEAHGHAQAHDHEGHGGETAVESAAAARPLAVPAPTQQRSFSGAIDGYARYEPQRTCSPSPKPGAVALQRLLMGGAPGSRNLGISRACHIGGSSEHKEGRAFDWGVLVHRPAERAAADAFLTRLLATDADGNRHALARRMGVMYVIWNQRIWSAYRPHDGWRPYSGRSPHTDHVHISLSWDGALGRTSYWSGQAIEGGLSFAATPTLAAPSRTATPTTNVPVPTGSTAPAPKPSAPHPGHGGDDGADRAAHEARKAAEEAARHQQRAAEEAARQQQKAAEEAARQQQRAAEEAARQQRKAAEEGARQQRKAAEEAARRQQQAAKEAERRERHASVAPAPAVSPGSNGGGREKKGGNGKGR